MTLRRGFTTIATTLVISGSLAWTAPLPAEYRGTDRGSTLRRPWVYPAAGHYLRTCALRNSRITHDERVHCRPNEPTRPLSRWGGWPRSDPTAPPRPAPSGSPTTPSWKASTSAGTTWPPAVSTATSRPTPGCPSSSTTWSAPTLGDHAASRSAAPRGPWSPSRCGTASDRTSSGSTPSGCCPGDWTPIPSRRRTPGTSRTPIANPNTSTEKSALTPGPVRSAPVADRLTGRRSGAVQVVCRWTGKGGRRLVSAPGGRRRAVVKQVRRCE